ncbi:membrane protein [Jatrophihabitans sp. GAS493]|uniref:YihY/virulence factor BrkB family protein n=1 Tax=Jatrophihabitans sp. GAS493 TaxID=1907575 RepID=UPI000BB9B59C|nr:YhjD/YihY/BrkB family envelope integrity protein [Jatrophihabitans sp. GAS493]SOD71956.1 membrane protein [Jatrophihabitans sp. GAS493]
MTVPAAKQRWAALRTRYHWLDHVLVAYQQYTDTKGNYYAAGITYFSFLAIFPLMFLAVSVSGFVLGNNSDLHDELFDNITKNVPGGFGDTLKTAIDAAIDQRAAVGLIGLVGVLLSGLGWIANLRQASNSVCGVDPIKRNFVMAKLIDGVVMIGFGIGITLSLVLSVGGTAFAHQVAEALNVDHIWGAAAGFSVLGLLLAVLGDMIVLLWVFARFPNARIPRWVLLRGALLAALGLEVLKFIGTAYIARIATSPLYGVLGSIIGVLVWINLVARYLLFTTTWTATASGVVLDPAAADAAAAAELARIEAEQAVEPELSPTQELELELRSRWRRR